MIETLHIGNAPDDKLTVTISGKVEEVVRVLTQGLPVEDLRAVADATADELRRRDVASWQPIETAPENEVVLTKIHDERGERNEARLKRKGRLWWFADGSMYVYYTPTHWKPLVQRAAARG